ncbi:MAG: hypothetical protein ACRCUE_01970 [Bosea sp. (in: a-proteobacteria)]
MLLALCADLIEYRQNAESFLSLNDDKCDDTGRRNRSAEKYSFILRLLASIQILTIDSMPRVRFTFSSPDLRLECKADMSFTNV